MKQLGNDDEYRSAGYLEDSLRKIADETPGWLYDATGLGHIIDDLNHARFLFEIRFGANNRPQWGDADRGPEWRA